ncbi:ABC transporter ATP-binding protein [Nocardiopsis suaedae]|uniref:ABC transporter ATP-binding protein n=1 Tax=Nocardiopsis suaedae TaxID=3018444 RepID=A0ABT4TQ28_9ACTN|nr:ABC transporter ATP-binding protein [Nocardiopsis suaedae]MDA2806466.1 ABC transporter ATP-binding protein [Nocardiopsis suaedae]
MTAPLPVASRAEVRRAVLREVRADRGMFAALLTLNALAAVAGLLPSWLLGSIVDTVAAAPGPGALAEVDRLAMMIVLAVLAQILLTRRALSLGHRFGERIALRFRERFMRRLLDLPPPVADQAPVGDLTARGTADIARVSTVLRTALPELFVAASQGLLLVVAVLVLDPFLGACALGALVVLAAALRWYLKRARGAYLAEGAANSGLAEVLTGTAAGARTVEALSLQEERLRAADAAIAEAHRTRLGTLRLRTVLLPAIDISSLLPLVGVLLVGGAFHLSGQATLGTVVTAAMLLRQLSGPIEAAMLWVEQLQASGASFARAEGLGAVPPGPPPAAREPADDRIRMDGVRYAYGGRDDVLTGVSLDIEPGERIAVVGASGAGKSTLGRLLAGLDGPRTGTVTVGGVPIAELPPERLRRQVVLIVQEQHVFRDTLRDNLLIAAPDADDARLADALEAVGASWASALPDGLDTVLGGDRNPLSGAEAQQLALARVVLADPHTIVLDEATALLDPATARATERSLAELLEGRTVVAIAHRLQTARDADRIAVMEQGRIVELGPHGDLVSRGGPYAALWSAWSGGPGAGSDPDG